VVVTERIEGEVVTFVLQPNRSLDWRGNLRLFGLVSILLLGISGWFAWRGAWLVFPFAGLELVVFGFALYLVSVSGLNKETVSLKGDELEICKGRWQIESTICLQRHWAQVVLKRSVIGWYPSRLYIRSHGKENEIGGFLLEDERIRLAQDLKRHLNK